MMKRTIVTAIMLVALSDIASAQSSGDRSELPSALGAVLASEEFCGMSYDQAGIAAFVNARVAADDMSFPSLLNTRTNTYQHLTREMTASAKTAHCTQIKRVAESYGFLKDGT